MKVFDQLPLIRERLRRVHDTLRQAASGSREHLFRRNVRIEIAARKRRFAAACKHAFGHEPHGKVGAVGRTVKKFFQMKSVQDTAAFGKISIVFVPVADGIAFRAGTAQDRLP